MRHWKLNEIETPDGSRSPAVLHSLEGESRVVLIGLDPGQELGEHQVKENACSSSTAVCASRRATSRSTPA